MAASSPAPLPGPSCLDGRFELYVAKASSKFNSAHFIAHTSGKRERIHGHNYRTEVTATGRPGMGDLDEGYLVDFGEIKAALKQLCSELDERFLCPADCAAIDVSQSDEAGICCPLTMGTFEGAGQLDIVVKHDGSRFSMPRRDAIVLPLAQASAELLARHICTRLVTALGGAGALWARGIEFLTVGVVETAHQEARFRAALRPAAASSAARPPAEARAGGE